MTKDNCAKIYHNWYISLQLLGTTHFRRR